MDIDVWKKSVKIEILLSEKDRIVYLARVFNIPFIVVFNNPRSNISFAATPKVKETGESSDEQKTLSPWKNKANLSAAG